MSASLRDIRRQAGPNVDVYHDRDGRCYRATCKPGYAWERGSLHELVAAYERSFEAEAREDLFERVQAAPRGEGPPVPCDAPGCDWCANERVQQWREEGVSDPEILERLLENCRAAAGLSLGEEWRLTPADLDWCVAMFRRKPSAAEWRSAGVVWVGDAHRSGGAL